MGTKDGIIFQLRRGLSYDWAASNPVLRSGEPGFEIDTHLYKLGDGRTPWLALEYFRPDVIPGDETGALYALHEHEVSDEPHPVYDDGPSLLLLYLNAKV